MITHTYNDPEIFIEIFEAIQSIKEDVKLKLGKHYEVSIDNIELVRKEDPDVPQYTHKFYNVTFLVINKQSSLHMIFDSKIGADKILYKYYREEIRYDLIKRIVENKL